MSEPTPEDFDLVFKHFVEDPTDTDLVFGKQVEPPVVTYQLSGHGTLPRTTGGGKARVIFGGSGSGSGTLPKVLGGGVLAYSSNVDRSMTHVVNHRWQDAAPLRTGAATRWQGSAVLSAATVARWQDATQLRAAVHTVNAGTGVVRTYVVSRWQDADRLRAQWLSHYYTTATVRAGAVTRWQDATQLRHAVGLGFQERVRMRTATVTRWQDATQLPRHWLAFFGGGRGNVRAGFVSRWQDATRPRPGRQLLPPPVDPEEHLCYDPLTVTELVFREKFVPGNTDLVFTCWVHRTPDVPALVVVPIQRTYIVLDDSTLIRLDTGDEIHAQAMNLSLSKDAWSWAFSASVDGAELAKLRPRLDGMPIPLQATVNGTPFMFVMDSTGRTRQFPTATWTLQARSRSVELADPYDVTQVFSNQLARSAEQLMYDVLTVNGVPLPWTVSNFALEDWGVPPGAFSHTGTRITALAAIAAAAGGYLQPHDTERELSVLHSYPVPPWQWASVAPQFELPMDIVTTDSFEWIVKPDYDVVFLSGEEGGVTGPYTKVGSGRLVPAEPVVDALITDAVALRQRGRAILGDSGRQVTVGLTLPVLPATGIIRPGQFVRYVDDSGSHLGLVRGVSVDVRNPGTMQRLTVETHGR